MTEPKLIVDHEYMSRSVRIYIQEFHGQNEVLLGVKDGKIIEQPIERFEVTSSVEPLLIMNDGLWKMFLRLVSDYASNEGIKTENENLLKGKLQATEKHLDDVRKQFEKVLDKIVSLPVLIPRYSVQECDATAAK